MNIMHAGTLFCELRLLNLYYSRVSIQLVDGSLTKPLRLVKDVFVNVDNLIFPTDFYVLNVNPHTFFSWNSVILGSPFLKTVRAKIDVGEWSLFVESNETIKISPCLIILLLLILVILVS